MSTLLLRLAAPLMSWGLDAKFERRTTETAPTKSAIIGLLSCALGYRREDEAIARLGKSLRYGVRVDQEGQLLRDFHTAKSTKTSYVTNRYYLSDAVMLVALEGEEALLEQLAEALRHPAFPLYLGRRSCPPEGNVFHQIAYGVSLEEALRQTPSLVPPRNNRKDARIIMDSAPNQRGSWFQRDQIISLSQEKREYGFRSVCEQSVPLPFGKASAAAETLHDALAELGGS